ncbi:hypothetical protein J2X20_002773 [Pelomonas saccharophila]|uniref:Uncharacterized protein n=1 Tax=Roseateles saccharophilus TaxID=304 RepID=A0ABU1YMP6_ROSSA|nr:hypothetical protein [Roseateles saccharophilus]MDR7270115.1 hypothetical protein [Roseateles saccharophilus]
MGPDDAIKACEGVLLEAIQWNDYLKRLPSECTIARRLLDNRDRLADSYAELYLKLGNGPALNSFLGLVLSAAAVWGDDLEPEDLALKAELIQLNRRIARSAAELSGFLDRREDLRHSSGLKDQTFYNVADLIDAAGDNDLYRYKLTASIDELRQRFDWKHWPSLAGVAEALGRDADEARVPEDSSATLEVASQIAPGSPERFLSTVFHMLSNIRMKNKGMFPDPFDVTNESLAALTNTALRLVGDDRLRAATVDDYYGDWAEARLGFRHSRIPYADSMPDFGDTDAPPRP